MTTSTYTRDQVSHAVNRAADAVASFRWDGDTEDAIDAANLTVNLVMHFLEHPRASVREAVEANFSRETADYFLGIPHKEGA